MKHFVGARARVFSIDESLSCAMYNFLVEVALAVAIGVIGWRIYLKKRDLEDREQQVKQRMGHLCGADVIERLLDTYRLEYVETLCSAQQVQEALRIADVVKAMRD